MINNGLPQIRKIQDNCRPEDCWEVSNFDFDDKIQWNGLKKLIRLIDKYEPNTRRKIKK